MRKQKSVNTLQDVYAVQARTRTERVAALRSGAARPLRERLHARRTRLS